MPSYRNLSLTRTICVLLLIALLALTLPASVLAAPARDIVLSFDVVAIKKDESVTLKFKEFPVRTKFALKMAVVGKKAVNGEVVAEFDTDKGGTFEKTFPIPAKLKGQLILAVRVDSANHYSADNWFINEDKAHPITNESQKPDVSVANVKKNASFTLQAKNLRPNTSYSVRVGPHYTFYRDYATLDPVASDANGQISAEITLPKAVQDKKADFIMVRLDGGGTYALASYKNVDGGGAVPQAQLVKVVYCTVINLNWIKPLKPGEDFDVVWTVQNTGPTDWNLKKLLYKWVAGEKTHKYDDWHPVGWTVKRGVAFDIAIDMIAPQEPGWHRTTWALMDGDQTLCKMNVSFAVEDN